LKIVSHLELLTARASPSLREPDNVRTFVSSTPTRGEARRAMDREDAGGESEKLRSRRSLKTQPHLEKGVGGKQKSSEQGSLGSGPS